MTIRELRQDWPAVERRLSTVGELVVTRDGKPVARLSPPASSAATESTRRFDPAQHARRIQALWRREKPLSATTGDVLAADRAERQPQRPSE